MDTQRSSGGNGIKQSARCSGPSSEVNVRAYLACAYPGLIHHATIGLMRGRQSASYSPMLSVLSRQPQPADAA
jgi:hypothetical protein